MKKILYFDACSGVSGDMFVGALIDAGACIDAIRSHISALTVDGIEIQSHKVSRGGIAATKFEVRDPRTGIAVDAPAARHVAGQVAARGHDHPHSNHHDHGRQQGQDADSHPAHRNQRGLKEIRSVIGNSRLPQAIKEDALAVFERLARAEAKVHGVDPEQVHFHEIGALDCIADIVAASSAFHQLGIDTAWCSAVHVGTGTVLCAHGVLPVPTPATLELLHGIPVYSSGIPGELATPTGVALLKQFCKGFGPMPRLAVEKVGYGAGSRELSIPNLLRATVGYGGDPFFPKKGSGRAVS
jgi:hypothetical protein